MGSVVENMVIELTSQRFRSTLTNMTTTHDDKVIPTNEIGLVWDGSDARCGTCDSRYCGQTCHAAYGTVYIAGVGYVNSKYAAEYEASGHNVRWHDRGWIIMEDPK